MKTITLTIKLTYDENIIHGDDKEALDWFFDDILGGGYEDNLLLHCNEIGDTIGSVKVLEIEREASDFTKAADRLLETKHELWIRMADE